MVPGVVIMIFRFFFCLLLLAATPVAAADLVQNKAQAVQRLAARLDDQMDEMIPVILRFREEEEKGGERSTSMSGRRRFFSSLDTASYERIRDYANFPLTALRVNREALDYIARNPDVIGVYENKRRKPSLMESVPQIGADKVREQGYSGSGQAVAVVDNGVDRDHPMLAGRVVAEACFSTGNRFLQPHCPGGSSEEYGPGSADVEPGDDHHGTHVAGIAAGRGGDGYPYGVAGGADIIAVRVDSSSLVGDTMYDADILAGLDYVYGLRDILSISAVNLSLGGEDHFSGSCDDISVYTDIFEKLRDADIAPVVASGNEYQTNGIAEPACVSSAVAVGAVYKDDRIWPGSNSGPTLDLLAPGVNITSADIYDPTAPPDANLATASGTSMAAPHVTGSFALLRSLQPDAKVDILESALKESGKHIEDERNGITTSRIDVAAAFQLLNPLPKEDPLPVQGAKTTPASILLLLLAPQLK